MRKRIIPARACYRDKSCGVGELRAKCRIVALGHLDPDLAEINRSSGTPGRVSEHMIFVMMTAGFNRELFGTKHGPQMLQQLSSKENKRDGYQFSSSHPMMD